MIWTDKKVDCVFSTEGIRLSRQEYTLYALLCEHSPKVVSHAEIYVNLLGGFPDRLTVANMAAVYICQLRKKIGKERIVTVRGEGYYLKCL